MARGKKPLNPIQEQTLKSILEVDIEWRLAKRTAMAEALAIAQRKVAVIGARRDALVIRGVQEGIPKVVISSQGLGASPNSVYDILKAYAGQAEVADQLAPTARYTVGEVYMPPGQANTRYLAAVVWVLDRDNPDLVTTAPIGEGLTHPGQRYAVTRTGELDSTNPTFTFTPAPGENDGELRDLLEEFGRGMAHRYKYLGSETGQPRMVVATETVQKPTEDLVPAENWSFAPPEGWDENDAGSLDDME